MSLLATSSTGSFSPATVNVFENRLLLGSLVLAMVMLYVSGADLSNGTVSGAKTSSVLRSLVRLRVGPTPEDISKLLPLSIPLITETIAGFHGWISQWYTKLPSLLNDIEGTSWH